MSFYNKRILIYILCGFASIVLLIAGAIIGDNSVAGSILIGIGCSGITASVITLFIEIRDSYELYHSQSVYFKKLYNSLIMLLQRILWFDERLSDSSFNWDLPPAEYSSLNYMMYSHKKYPTTKLNWTEFKDRIEQCEKRYELNNLNSFTESQQTTIAKMFTIIHASSSDLNNNLLRICMNDVTLASQNFISLEDIETMRFNITLSIGLMNKPNKNYGLAIRLLFKEADKLKGRYNYNNSDFIVSLQGMIQSSEL